MDYKYEDLAHSFFIDSFDIACECDLDGEEDEDKQYENELLIEEYVEKEILRFEDYLLRKIPRDKWSFAVYKIICDIDCLFMDYLPDDFRDESFKKYRERFLKNEENVFYMMVEKIFDQIITLVYKYRINEDNNKDLNKRLDYIGYYLFEYEREYEDEDEDEDQHDDIYDCIKKKQKYFDKAIESGFIEKTDNGYKWVFGGKVRLGYFLKKIYGVYERIPYKNIEKLFNETRLDRAVSQLDEAKTPQKWRIEIDKLIETLD